MTTSQRLAKPFGSPSQKRASSSCPEGPASTPVRMHPDLAGLYRKKVEDLEAALADEAARSEALTILRQPIEAIVLHPVDKSYELALVGEMASMVEAALGAGNEKAAPGRAALGAEDRRSVKLVAGTRSYRYRHSLPVAI